MKVSKFSDSQIISILKQAESGALMAQMKGLQLENAKLKKMYAEAQLAAEVLKEALAKKW